jgi:hypothetical protein
MFRILPRLDYGDAKILKTAHQWLNSTLQDLCDKKAPFRFVIISDALECAREIRAHKRTKISSK